MKIVLAHPPMDDPTIPYHSTAYLAGHLIQNGFQDVAIRDVNIEFVNWCLEKEVVESFYEEADRRLRGFEQRGELSFIDQEEYLNLWSHPQIEFPKLARAVEGMRRHDRFLDFEEYKESISILLRYFGFLGAMGYPSEIVNFRQATRGRLSPYNLRDLFDADLGLKICQPFHRYLEDRLAKDAQFREADCLGISIVYDHQLFHALHMARWFKRRWPEKTLLFGGTAVSQLYKYLKDPSQMKRFFAFCDGIVVGEGETAICQIAEAGGVVPGSDVRNLISCDERGDKLHIPPFVHYEDVPSLGRPAFQYDWDLYLAPERGINYAPTRGCYWNRCTFCDYGLNTAKPTSPWRERRIDQVIEDLREATRATQARYVYFAVDVMSPAYLDRLSDAIYDAKLDIKWSAEMRMEKVFSAERCQKMRQSGCVCVSFGMESGSQRVLDLIDKGTKVAFMGETMKNFAQAGIAVQLMAFTDFPTETEVEKEETYRFVEEHKDYWSAGGMGIFMLTGTAIVAKDPARFGIRLIETQDADIARALTFELAQANGRDDHSEEDEEAVLTEDRDASFDSDGGVFPGILGRPWAGGTDTLHTMIYYDHHGRMFFRDHPKDRPLSRGPESDADLLQCSLFLPGFVRESPFDVSRIILNRREFARYIKALQKVPKEPTYEAFQQWAAQAPALQRNPNGTSYWVRASQKCVPLDKLLYRLLGIGATAKLPLHDLLRGFDNRLVTRILAYLRELGQLGLIELNPPRGGFSSQEVEGPSISLGIGGPASTSPPVSAVA